MTQVQNPPKFKTWLERQRVLEAKGLLKIRRTKLTPRPAKIYGERQETASQRNRRKRGAA